MGKIFLPDCSYREMTEWALPTERQTDYENVSHEMESDPRWPMVRGFMRGGFWRNFKVKYPEADEMYSRMMQISSRIQEAQRALAAAEPVDAALLQEAQTEMYRGQCNCGYWHGAFGGIYLPHLRNAVYARLIAADNLLDRATARPDHWVEAVVEDFNFDARQEVRLANDKLVAMIAPCRGGLLYELDVRNIEHNLLATFTRKPEAYHRKVLGGASQGDNDCASIHDRVVFKQEGLDQRIQYDDYPRKSLVDLFYEGQPSLEAVAAGEAQQIGDFTDGVYEARVRRNPDRIQVQLTRDGLVGDLPVRITKGLTLDAGGSALEIAYQLEGLPQDRPLNFAVELNFAGMPGGVDDRFFRDAQGNQLGRLDTRLDLNDVSALGLSDRWLGIDVDLKTSKPTGFWTFPIETVSQSEGGFELVHQSVAVQPHWQVVGDAEGRWNVTLQMAIDTSRAENHRKDELATATG